MFLQQASHDFAEAPRVGSLKGGGPLVLYSPPACMDMISRTDAVEIVEFRNIVEQASALSSVAPVLTVMEKGLADICPVHEFFPLRQQPKVASGRVFTREILMIFDAKLADVKD